MRKLVTLFVLFVAALPVWATATNGNGAPTAACAVGDVYTQNDAAGAQWNCINYLGLHVWNFHVLYSYPSPVGGNNGTGGTITASQVIALLNGQTLLNVFIADPTPGSQQLATAHYADTHGSGAQGPAGPGMYANAGPPATISHNVGDFVIDTTAMNLYGPKAATGTIWPLVGPIKGANGTNGSNGTNGTNGTNGASGSTPSFVTGNITTLSPGAAATAAVRVVGVNQYAIDLGIPTGPPGADGAAGANGTNGTNGTNGADTPPATLLIGNVATLASGALATANVRASSDPFTFYLDLGIPSAGTTGGGTPPPGTDPGTNIGTIAQQVNLTDGNTIFKTCYVGSSVCSGGVGTAVPASTPTSSFGLNTPSATTGTPNSVGTMAISTNHLGADYTQALWTPASGQALPAQCTSTNFARDFYVKVTNSSGIINLEFDTFSFCSSWDYMAGTQCNGHSNLIQYDNQGNGWVNTSAGCGVLFDGNWHHVKQTFHRDLPAVHNCAGLTAPCIYWDTVTIDGVLTPIGKTLPATTTSWAQNGAQWQIDQHPTAVPATTRIYVDTDMVYFGDSGDGTTNPGGSGGGTSGTGELDSFNFDSGTPTSVGLAAVGSPTISTSNAHTAPNSAAFPTGNNYYTDVLATPTSVLYTRQYIYVSSVSSTTVMGILKFFHSGAQLFSYYLGQTTPTVTGNNQATATTAGGGTVPAGAIHLVETYTKISPTAGQYIIKVDGTVTYTSASNLNTGTGTIDTVWFGSTGSTTPAGWGTTYMDNVDFSAAGWIGPI